MKTYDDESRVVPGVGSFQRGDEVPDDIAAKLVDAGLRVKNAVAKKQPQVDNTKEG